MCACSRTTRILIASFQASLGYTLRTSQVAWPTGASGGVVFGDSIPWTLGFVVRPALLHPVDPDGRQTWELALHGSLPAGPVGPFGLGQPGSAEESPVLLALSDRIALGRYKDGFLLAGVDVGLDHAVGVPTIRATIGVGLRLDSHDRDGDGIPDDRDQCPRSPRITTATRTRTAARTLTTTTTGSSTRRTPARTFRVCAPRIRARMGVLRPRLRLRLPPSEKPYPPLPWRMIEATIAGRLVRGWLRARRERP